MQILSILLILSKRFIRRGLGVGEAKTKISDWLSVYPTVSLNSHLPTFLWLTLWITIFISFVWLVVAVAPRVLVSFHQVVWSSFRKTLELHASTNPSCLSFSLPSRNQAHPVTHQVPLWNRQKMLFFTVVSLLENRRSHCVAVVLFAKFSINTPNTVHTILGDCCREQTTTPGTPCCTLCE